MLQIQKNVDLLPYNTFRVSAEAKSFITISSVNQLHETTSREAECFILGEGANVLFTKNFDGLVIKNEIKGREVISDDNESIILEVGSGENWHKFVMYAVENSWSGIENLALIPGTVGAAPVQNLAAYGQNFGDVAVEVKGFDITNLSSLRSLKPSELNLYYRDSVFKHELKDKFFITSVTLKLSKKPRYDTHYHGSKVYESLQAELDKIAPGESQYSPKQVAQAVINLRTIKMPDWHKIGTAGSFFKNPFVSKSKFAELQKEIPDLQAYPVDHMLYPNPDDPIFKMSNQVKIPAGKLLDKLGWRGKRIGNVGTFEKHALVIVNHGGATGQEILEFSQMMQEDIKQNYDINLEPEVNII